MSQGAHEQRNYPLPHGIIDNNRVASRHHSMKGQAQTQEPILRSEQAAQHVPTGWHMLQEACASKEASSLSAPRAVTSRSNRATIKASLHSEDTPALHRKRQS
jgi:hypothetical protein